MNDSDIADSFSQVAYRLSAVVFEMVSACYSASDSSYDLVY